MPHFWDRSHYSFVRDHLGTEGVDATVVTQTGNQATYHFLALPSTPSKDGVMLANFAVDINGTMSPRKWSFRVWPRNSEEAPPLFDIEPEGSLGVSHDAMPEEVADAILERLGIEVKRSPISFLSAAPQPKDGDDWATVSDLIDRVQETMTEQSRLLADLVYLIGNDPIPPISTPEPTPEPTGPAKKNLAPADSDALRELGLMLNEGLDRLDDTVSDDLVDLLRRMILLLVSALARIEEAEAGA